MKEFVSPTVAFSIISTLATIDVWFHCHNGVDLVGGASFVEFAVASDSGTNGSTPLSIRLKDVREAARAQNQRSIGMYDSTFDRDCSASFRQSRRRNRQAV
jgi:hypothetical protein